MCSGVYISIAPLFCLFSLFEAQIPSKTKEILLMQNHRNLLTLGYHPEFDLYLIYNGFLGPLKTSGFLVCQKSKAFLSIPEKNNSALNALHYPTWLFFS